MPTAPNQTRFSQLIAECPLEDAAHEALLAHVLAHVACADDRVPTLAERAFIDRFIPRVETPIDTLAEQALPREGLDDLDAQQRTMIMAVALVVAQLDRARGVTEAVVLRIAEAIALPIDRLADIEAMAREYIVEQRLSALYANGMPSEADRGATFASLLNLGADEEMVKAWDAKMFAQASAQQAETAATVRPREDRHDRFMSRHDPTSDNHRVSSAVGVFGSR